MSSRLEVREQRLGAAGVLGVSVLVIATAGSATGGDCDVYDNGDTDGVNGYANGTRDVFGARRTLLDDFEVPGRETWILEELRHVHVWSTLEPGAGAGMQIAVWSDIEAAPGEPIHALTVTDYREQATGRTFFDRPEAASWTSFEPVFLEPGRYWLEATIVGSEPNYWLTAPVRHSPCWVNYEDRGGLQPGRAVFGSDADLAWCLAGAALIDEPFYAFGLRHRIEGRAEIANGERGFVISNIGSSGEDGVSVHASEVAEGWLGAGELVAGDLTAGARVVIRARGTIDEIPDRDLGATIITSDGRDLVITPDLGDLDAVTYTLRLTKAGVVVFSRSGIPEEAEFATVPVGQTTRLEFACRLLPSAERLSWSLAPPAAVQVQVPEGRFLADGLEIVPDGATAGLSSISGTALLLSDTPDVRVDDEALRVFQIDHRAVGEARLSADADGLVVFNLGPDGDDGVFSELPATSGLDVVTRPIAIDRPATGLFARATGTFGGSPDTALGVAGFRNLGGLAGVFADFTGISVSNLVLLEVYDGGELAGSSIEEGNLFRVAPLLDGPEGEPRIVGVAFTSSGEELPGYHVRLDRRGEVRPNVGGSFIGDEIRLRVADPAGAVERLSAFELAAARLSTIAITALALGPAPCPADLDGTGAVDVGDLLAILARWGHAGGREDLDGSGLVDVGDLLVVLAAWGACP